MISFFNLHELFSASICADNIEGLLKNLFRFKMFYLVPVTFLFLSAIVFLALILRLYHLLMLALVVNHRHLNVN